MMVTGVNARYMQLAYILCRLRKLIQKDGTAKHVSTEYCLASYLQNADRAHGGILEWLMSTPTTNDGTLRANEFRAPTAKTRQTG
jgi:hypothetical protein